MTEHQVTFAAVGDIMLDNHVSRNIETRGPDFPFLNVVSKLKHVDIVFGNLETPLTLCQEKTIWDFSKYGWNGRAHPIFLKGSPRAAIGLRNTGFSVVSIANNHILDYGMKGANETIKVLRENRILPVGFGLNAREATTPKLLEVKGVRFAFFACSFAYEATFFSPGVAPIEPWTLRRQVKRAKRLSDVIVVSLHLGREFDESPSPSTARLAHALIESGAQLVLCHHPHTLQEVETYKKGLIAHSLGNFVFDYDSLLKRARARGHAEETVEKSKRSIILKCTISKDTVSEYSLIPTQLNKQCQPTPILKNSKLRQSVIHKVRAPIASRILHTDRKKGSTRHQAIKALNGFTVNLRRKDLKSSYILLKRIMGKLYESTLPS